MKKLKGILLIDDDETTNIINEMLIMEMGITEQLFQARNGKEAIDLLQGLVNRQQVLPELIFLDINMPVMDGFAFLAAYKGLDFPEKATINIVMLTTSPNPIDIERAEKAGVTEYVTKPLLEESLQSILEQCI